MTNEPKPSIIKYVGVFTAGFMAAIALSAAAQLVLGLKGLSNIDLLAALLGALAAAYCFVRQNRRTFTSQEYRLILAGSLGVDALLQAALVLLTQGARLEAALDSASPAMIVASAGFFVAMHVATLALIYSDRMLKGFLAKQ